MVPLTEVRNSGGRAEVTDLMGDRYLALSPVKCEMSDSVFKRSPEVCVRDGLHGGRAEGKTQVRKLLRWSR